MIRAFGDGDLDEAAALLERRHRRHLESEPLLPAAPDFRAEVEMLWRSNGAAGAIAERGFVLGCPRDDPVWGANVWFESAGHAADEPELVRDLYASLAGDWIERGLAPLLVEHQHASPVFGPARRWSDDEFRKEVLDDLSRDDVGSLVVEVDGRVVANFFVCSIELAGGHAGLARPPGAAYLAFAVTHPDARGSGVGAALTDACFAWARERGYATMVTDWRITNLLSSRFWPKRGFRTTFLRLHRLLA